jgi:hypothetical protein
MRVTVKEHRHLMEAPCGWELFVPSDQVVERLGADRCTVCANYDGEGR